MTGVLIRRGEDTETQEKPCEDGGRAGEMWPHAQERLEPPGAAGGRKGPPQSSRRELGSADTFMLDFWPSEN